MKLPVRECGNSSSDSTFALAQRSNVGHAQNGVMSVARAKFHESTEEYITNLLGK